MTKIFNYKFYTQIIQTVMVTGILAVGGGIWYYGTVLTSQPQINKELKESIELTQTECKERNQNTNYRIDKIQDRQAKVDSMFVEMLVEKIKEREETKKMQKQIDFIYINNKELNKYINVFNMTENDRKRISNN